MNTWYNLNIVYAINYQIIYYAEYQLESIFTSADRRQTREGEFQGGTAHPNTASSDSQYVESVPSRNTVLGCYSLI